MTGSFSSLRSIIRDLDIILKTDNDRGCYCGLEGDKIIKITHFFVENGRKFVRGNLFLEKEQLYRILVNDKLISSKMFGINIVSNVLVTLITKIQTPIQTQFNQQ